MKTNPILITSLLLSLCLTACNDSSNKSKKLTPTTTNQSPFIGVWQTPAYGIVANIQKDSIEYFQTSSNYCQPFELSVSYTDFVENSELSDDQSSLLSTLGGLKIPGMHMDRLSALPDTCANELLPQKGDEDYQFDPQQEFEVFWQTFNEYYAFFALENVDWHASYQWANNQISANTTEVELLEIFKTLIAPLKDFHVAVENEALGIIFNFSRKPEHDSIALAEFVSMHNLSLPLSDEEKLAFENYFNEAHAYTLGIILSYMSEDFGVKSNATQKIHWSKTSDNLGYMLVNTMDLEEIGGAGDDIEQNISNFTVTLAEIIADFTDVDGIIVDVRFNPGGNDETSQLIVSHLIEKELHAYNKQARLGDDRTPIQKVVITPAIGDRYTGPIVVLTSATTSSAAEIFALAMQSRDNTVLIGEATGGGLSDILPKSLPSGTEFTLSNEIYSSPSGDEYEGVGIPVDFNAPFFTSAQREAEHDLGIIKAIEWFTN